MAQDLPGREVFHSLTGLRFVLAIWITVYHLAMMYGPEGLSSLPFLAVGNARVDGFFLLSGFVLGHIYAVRTGGRFAFGPFLQARIARLYPLHLLALVMLLAAVAAAAVVGRGEEVAAYTPLGFFANVFMLQAWGVPGAGYWNFPAWTLSAEFFAYLCFPAMVWAAARFAARPWLLLALAFAVVAALELAWSLFGTHRLGALTQDGGVIRGACGVLIGLAARYAFDKVTLRGGAAAGTALAGALVAGAAAVAEAPLAALHAGGVLLLFGLAALDREGKGSPLATPVMRRLGDMSYALFILHVPIFVVATRALGLAGWDGTLTFGVGAALLAVAMGAAAVANRLIEDPAREVIRSWRLFPPSPRLKTP